MRGYCLLITMLLVTGAMAQAPQSATVSTQMETPPPVSTLSYSTQVGSEVGHNYLRGGVIYTTSYVDNYFVGSTSTKLAETMFSVLPTVTLDTATSRQRVGLTYSPGFTFYHPSSSLNEVDNTAAVNYDFRLTPHATLSIIERFQDSSSPYSPEDASSGSVSGAPVSTTPGAVPPFAKHLTNSVSAEITAQTGLNEMVGASGSSMLLHYPNTSQTPGLGDSNSRGGTAFYSHRISSSQYAGVTYQYMDMLTTPVGSESTTTTSTVMGYYSIYPRARLSLSISGGPQYYRMTGTSMADTSSWAPAVTASMGWQADRVSFAGSYSQSVTAAGGLFGAFHTKSANAAVYWRAARAWSIGGSGSYALNKAAGAALQTESTNGYALTGSAMLQHPIGRQLSLTFNYDRIHQEYDGVAAIAANPDSDRFSFSISWKFQRPLGK
jgi:hypothetical protein